MGEAKRKRKLEGEESTTASPDEYFRGVIDLHMLPSVPEINVARIRQLTGDTSIPEATELLLMVFRVLAGERTFLAGFCIGDGERFSPIGIGVIQRLMKEAPGKKIHVVSIIHEDVA